MSAKYIPLTEIVAQFLDQHDKSGADKDKVWGLCYRALELMHYNTQAEPKTLRLPVLPNKIVQFPSDYIQWSKVGIMNSAGETVTLVVNNKLTKWADQSPNRLSLMVGDVQGYNPVSFWVNYWDGYGYSPLYGVGYGVENFGEFTIDERNELIVLNPDFKYQYVLFEYICAPEKDYDYKIDRRLREAVIEFVMWKYQLSTREEFYAAYAESRRMIDPFNIQTFNQVIREQNKFCLKL